MGMGMLLDGLVTIALRKLDDELTEVWQRDELKIYARTGYDDFARRTKCIFDVVVIENLHPVGGYGSDLQRYLAEHSTAPDQSTIPDRRILFTQPGERDKLGEPVAAGDAIPITATDLSQATGPVPGGRLPDNVVSVLRVSWDRMTLAHETPQSLREVDPVFESREGDPQAWLWGEDGLLSVRVWPAAAGDAPYDQVVGRWGTRTYTTDSTVSVDLGGAGGYGILREQTDCFPSGGLHGSPTRIHPDAKNIQVEITRLGRDPQIHELEIPRTFWKAIVFFTMSEALKRDGPGQDLKLSQHYSDRFELAVTQMEARMRKPQREERHAIGAGGENAAGLGGLRLSLPSMWGYPKPLRQG